MTAVSRSQICLCVGYFRVTQSVTEAWFPTRGVSAPFTSVSKAVANVTGNPAGARLPAFGARSRDGREPILPREGLTLSCSAGLPL